MTREELDGLLLDCLWQPGPLEDHQRAALMDALLDHGDQRSADVLRECGPDWMLARHGDTGHVEVIRTNPREGELWPFSRSHSEV